MNYRQLSHQFDQAVNWNTALYTTHKTTSTIVTFLLYAKLSPIDFSTWATINSLVFLTLLWIDCGLRKSIPRFAPIFATNKISQRRFIRTILFLQTSLIIGATIPFILSLSFFFPMLFIDKELLFITGLFFISEGIIALLGLIYHSYFRQKTFNTISIICLLCQTMATIAVIFNQLPKSTLILSILTIKLFTNALLGSIAYSLLSKIKEDPLDNQGEINYKKTMSQFYKHSGIMWGGLVLKSLSERNFLLPILVKAVGPEVASLYKVANDGALLFQRIILKTIGTGDTSLLSYTQTGGDEKVGLNFAYKKIMAKIKGLLIPLLGSVGVCSLLVLRYKGNGFNAFLIFFIILFGYATELALLPGERVLEVKFEYRRLIIAYTPYVCVLLILLTSSIGSLIGLPMFLICLFGVRLVSLLIMNYYVRSIYKLIPIWRNSSCLTTKSFLKVFSSLKSFRIFL